MKTVIAFCLAGLVLAGCASHRPVVEYRYIEQNCTTAREVVGASIWHPVRWVVVDVNGTRLYATPDGATLFSNISGLR